MFGVVFISSSRKLGWKIIKMKTFFHMSSLLSWNLCETMSWKMHQGISPSGFWSLADFKYQKCVLVWTFSVKGKRRVEVTRSNEVYDKCFSWILLNECQLLPRLLGIENTPAACNWLIDRYINLWPIVGQLLITLPGIFCCCFLI